MTCLCVHCGKPILLIRWALGNQWMHDPVGQGRHREMESMCRTAPEATPDDSALVAFGPNTGIYERTGG